MASSRGRASLDARDLVRGAVVVVEGEAGDAPGVLDEDDAQGVVALHAALAAALEGEAPVLAAGDDQPELLAARGDLEREAGAGAVLACPARAQLGREREVERGREARGSRSGPVGEHALHERLVGALLPLRPEGALEQRLVDALVAEVAEEELRDAAARVLLEHGRVAAGAAEDERPGRAPARTEDLELVRARDAHLERAPAPALALGTGVAVHDVGVAAGEGREVELLVRYGRGRGSCDGRPGRHDAL